MWLSIIVSLALIYILTWVYKRHRALNVLQSLGYSVPPVNFFCGNLLELVKCSNGGLDTQTKWMTDFAQGFGTKGRILGWYRGPSPVIYSTNPEFLKEVFIKQSDTFIDRPMLDRSDNIPHLIMLKGHHWKRVRSILTPTFSSAKMKKMASIMVDAIDILSQVVTKHAVNKTEANFYNLYQGLTLDVIGQCGLAMKVNCQLDENDELLVMVKKTLKQQFDVTAIIASFFPELEGILSWMYRGGRKKTNDVIISWCDDILKKRRKMGHPPGEKPIDSLQLMMDAAAGDPKKLSDEEITANAFVFILAGYETTATSLAFTTYLIAAHPEVQEKLIAEIDALIPEGGKSQLELEKLTETILDMPYLNQVFNESLRMYPPIPLHFGRWADTDKVICGKVVPKGTAVMIPTWYIHHDPDLWPDPWKFDPERFSPESRNSIKEMSFVPFGEGPRKCIGSRFANLEAKLALVLLLRKFTFKLGPNITHPIKFRNKGISLGPQNDEILLVPELRNK